MSKLPISFTIAGPAGSLEAIVTSPPLFTTSENSHPITNTVAVICHPHPLYKGNMHNKVVSTLARAFDELEVGTVRFNFRGIGNSEGTYDQGKGELDDLIAVIHWVRAQFPNCFIWLAGFSFGAYIAMQAAAQLSNFPWIKQLITVAPAVNHFSPSEELLIQCSWLFIIGEADEIVLIGDVKLWISKQIVPINCYYLPTVGHFFHSHLVTLKEIIITTLKKAIPNAKSD